LVHVNPIVQQLVLTWRLLLDGRVPLYAKLAVLLPLIYFISPIDLIPDVILGLGQLDDLAIIIGGFKLFESLSPAAVVQEHRAALGMGAKPKRDAGGSAEDDAARRDPNVVEGRNYEVRQKRRNG
jgi:uncharacterized membrane protein YkvA (DUF1232 family)